MGLFGSSKNAGGSSGVVDLVPAAGGGIGERCIGQTFLKRYKVRKFLGEGSNAHVFLATVGSDPKRFVVVKRIKDEASSAPRFRQFFEAEVRSMARFSHPYIVRLIDASTDDPNGACLVMEYISGVTLEAVLNKERAMSPDRLGKVLGPLGHALYAAQLAGIVHRDLKPANLMVTGYGTDAESVRVMDFGFAGFTARPHIQLSELTGKGSIFACGTPAYVSPEMARGDSTDARADIYSVGVMLYELLTGRLPFEHQSVERIVEAHVRDQPPRFHRIGCGHIPAAVEAVVQVALSKFPSERHQTMKDLVEQFGKAVGWDVWGLTAPEDYVYSAATESGEVILATPGPVPNRADAASERFVLSDLFEATLPEKLAAIKLRGFIDDVGGEVLESEPGLIRVRVEMPVGYKEPSSRPSSSSGVFAFLSGVVRANPSAPRGKEPIEIELQMKKQDANKVSVLVAFRPVQPFLPTDPVVWSERCEAYYAHLRRFVMAEG